MENRSEESRMKSKSMDVAMSFTKHLFLKEKYQESNLIYSPFCLQAALSVIAAGAAGRTLDELLSFLRFDSVDHLTTFFSQVISPLFSSSSDAADASSRHLYFVNTMWAENSLPILHSFKQLVTTHYKATLASLDFKTQRDQLVCEVNSWIEKETNGIITQLLPPEIVTDLTRLIFANALRFRGEWKHKLKNMPGIRFRLLNGTYVEAPYLIGNKKTEYVRAFDGFKILRLPYKQGRDRKRRFSMCIFLPDAKDGLSALIEKLSSEPGFLRGKLPRRKVPVEAVQIPRFNISFSFEASNVLKEVGVVSSFSQLGADLTKMAEVSSSEDNLFVDSIFHKAVIAVNDKGTEATASLVGDVRVLMGGVFPTWGISFLANHPFLFLIREDFTGTVLFVGQVLNPLDGAPRRRGPGPGVRY